MTAPSRNTLQAVMDEDLREFLQSIGQLELFEKGEGFCRSCGTLLTLKNIQLIVPLQEGGFTFVCDRPDCVAAAGSAP